MTYLRFDTDRGRDTVAQLRQVIENMRTESESTHANINALVGSAWIAPAAYEFQKIASNDRQSLNSVLERLTELSARLDAEIAEWEETAAVFGGRGSHSVAGSVARSGITPDSIAGSVARSGIMHGGKQSPPATLKGLYEEIRGLPSNSPVRIYKVGENDYLILMRGMEINSPSANNTMDAVASGLGLPSDYERQIEESIKKAIPPSANIHFVGHSQGGIIAQSLADNQDFLDQYHVKEVITIGSPGTNFNANPDVKYEAFADIADPIPYLDRRLGLAVGAVGAAGAIGGASMASVLGKTLVANGMKHMHFVSGNKFGNSAHTRYEKTLPDVPISELLGDSVDLNYNDPSGKWNTPQDIMLGRPTDSLSLVSNELFHPQSWIDPVRGVVDIRSEATKTIGLGLIDNLVVEPTEQIANHLFPDSGIRDSIDRYTDRVYSDILRSPSVSDTVTMLFKGTANTATEVVKSIDTHIIEPLI